jgi:DNA-directed RNA polymerase specialized sigma24 family protein
LLAAHLLSHGADGPELGALLDRVFLQIHAARRTWRPGSPVGPWLTAIVQHVLRTEVTSGG